MLFGYFLHDAKSNNPYSLRREIRGFANLESAHSNNDHALTKLKPSQRGVSRFCKPRFSPPKPKLHTNPIKSFCRSAASLAASPLLFRFAAVSLPGRRSLPGTFPYFLLDTKSMTKKPLKLSYGKFAPFGAARSACKKFHSGGTSDEIHR